MHRLISIPLSLLLTTASAGSLLSKRDNAVLKDAYTADPHMAIFGDTYYIYPTTDMGNGQDFAVWSSKDLVTWTQESTSPILQLDGESETGHVPWAVGSAWAPGVIERDGTYYFYHCGHTPEHPDDNVKYIGVATASSPTGPFTGQSTPFIFNNETISTTVAIDPQAFLDPNTGKYHLYWGNGACLHAELNDDMVSYNEETLTQYTRDDGLSDYQEAPFLVYREGKYHMTYSIDVTSSADYRVGYAVSSDGPGGPWENRGIILEKDEGKGIYGTGHQAVVNVPGTDDWYIAYHRWLLEDGGDWQGRREVCLEKLGFDEEGFIMRVEPTLEGVGEQRIEV